MNERLKLLLFLLMREHVSIGKMRALLAEVKFGGPPPFTSEPHLSAIAEDMAAQLEEPKNV